MNQRAHMEMTEQDLHNADDLKRALHAESRAEAIRTALNYTAELARFVRPGDEITVRHKNGLIRKIDMPGINSE